MPSDWYFDNGSSREVFNGPETIEEARDALERLGLPRDLRLIKVIPHPPKVFPDPDLWDKVKALSRYDEAGDYCRVDDVVRLLVSEGLIPPLGG